MGRPRVKTIDDSAVEVEEKKKSKARLSEKVRAKSEVAKATGEVERTTEAKESTQEQGAKQTGSESAGETSGTSNVPATFDRGGALQPDERAQELKSKVTSKSLKPGKSKPRSKKYQELVKDLDRTKTYSLSEAVDMVKKVSYAKFNATLNISINTSQTGIRGLVSLPYAKSKQLRILAFGPSQPQSEGVVFGDESTIEEINKGKVNFDLVVTTPAWMPKLTKVARILGPRGLMPNPKNGTITEDLKKAVEGFQAGKTEYKTEAKAPIIHIAAGKLNQPNEELAANIKILLQTIGKTRIKKVTLSPTMGPSVKLDLSFI